MDFQPSPRSADLASRVREFIDTEVTPVEPVPRRPASPRPQQSAWLPVVTPQVSWLLAEIERKVWPPTTATGALLCVLPIDGVAPSPS